MSQITNPDALWTLAAVLFVVGVLVIAWVTER